MTQNVFLDLATYFRSHQYFIGRPTLLSAISDRVTDWSARGALVIGDAAHTMSPVGGQGINIALRDAIVAANHLVPIFRSTPSDYRIDVTARAIGLERTAELAHIQRLQAFPPRVLDGSLVAECCRSSHDAKANEFQRGSNDGGAHRSNRSF